MNKFIIVAMLLTACGTYDEPIMQEQSGVKSPTAITHCTLGMWQLSLEFNTTSCFNARPGPMFDYTFDVTKEKKTYLVEDLTHPNNTLVYNSVTDHGRCWLFVTSYNDSYYQEFQLYHTNKDNIVQGYSMIHLGQYGCFVSYLITGTLQ